MTAIQLRRHARQPVERLQLSYCLRLLGVKPDRKAYGNSLLYFYLTRGPKRSDLSEGRLYDLLELAHKAYKKLCKKHRTDLAENHKEAVWLNALWVHTKKLFRRRRIEIP